MYSLKHLNYRKLSVNGGCAAILGMLNGNQFTSLENGNWLSQFGNQIIIIFAY